MNSSKPPSRGTTLLDIQQQVSSLAQQIRAQGEEIRILREAIEKLQSRNTTTAEVSTRNPKLGAEVKTTKVKIAEVDLMEVGADLSDVVRDRTRRAVQEIQVAHENNRHGLTIPDFVHKVGISEHMAGEIAQILRTFPFISAERMGKVGLMFSIPKSKKSMAQEWVNRAGVLLKRALEQHAEKPLGRAEHISDATFFAWAPAVLSVMLEPGPRHEGKYATGIYQGVKTYLGVSAPASIGAPVIERLKDMGFIQRDNSRVTANHQSPLVRLADTAGAEAWLKKNPVQPLSPAKQAPALGARTSSEKASQNVKPPSD